MFDFSSIIAAAWLCLLPLRAYGLFEQCNHRVQLEAGQKIYINSPYYPAEYPVGTSCRYIVQAPTDYKLKFKCELKLNTPKSDTRCQHESFHFNPEGNELLSNSEYFCGNGNFERKSFLNRAVISYMSMPQYKRKAQVTAAISSNNNNKNNKVEHVLLKDKLSQVEKVVTSVTTPATKTTSKPTTDKNVSIEEQNELETLVTEATQQVPPVSVSVEEQDVEHENEYDFDLLNVFADLGVDDALAYVTGFFNSDEKEEVDDDEDDKNDDEGRARSTKLQNTQTWLRALVNRTKSTSKRGKIVAPIDGPTTSDAGGGTFSCLVEVLETACACGWSMALKVAGPPAEAGINEYTAMAGVLTKRLGKVFCGAAIIHHRYLLSAAHCFQSPETNRSDLLRVVVGEHDLSTAYETLYTFTYDILDILPHEQFSAATESVQNDIALLRTRDSITWNRSVGPACLPWRTSIFSPISPVTGQRLEVAGWGTTSFGGAQSQRLLKTTLDVIDTKRCRLALQATTPAHTFCTFTPGRDTCQYDSGGALYERRGAHLTAVGIVSYGYACATHQPSVNTRISAFLPWILSKTPEVKYCVK